MKRKKIFFFSFIAVMVVAIVGIWAGLHYSGAEKTYKVPPISAEESDFNYDKQPSIGEDTAPVRVVEFGDFKCPACKQWEATIYPSLKKDFIDTGKVKFYFINFPFLAQDSFNAAAVGEAVYAQDKATFWKYYSLVYDKQQNEKLTWATPEYLTMLVRTELKNIDADKLVSDMQAASFDKAVQDDYDTAGKYKIPGTPAIFVNGVTVANPFDYNALKKTINSVLKKSEVTE